MSAAAGADVPVAPARRVYSVANVNRALARIEEARRRLDADGLFEAGRKSAPPLWPRGIGLIAGRDAAAPLDVIRNARARLPSARFVLAETAVQGERAVPEILSALTALD